MEAPSGLEKAEIFDGAGTTPAEKRNVATAKAIFEALSRGDFAALPKYLAPGTAPWILGFTPERLGKHAANPGFVAETFVHGLLFEFRSIVVAGDAVVVEWRDEALTAKGKRYENDGITVLRFDDEGRITTFREYIDPERFFSVLD